MFGVECYDKVNEIFEKQRLSLILLYKLITIILKSGELYKIGHINLKTYHNKMKQNLLKKKVKSITCKRPLIKRNES